MSDTLLAFGVMSGTSADGVDVAAARIEWRDAATPRVEPVAHVHVPFDAALRDSVLEAASGRANTEQVALLHGRLGRAYAAAVARLMSEQGQPAVIGVHGQTVAHLPASRVTFQIGDAALVAVRSGAPVVADFRSADIAAGGEGAPLTPFADRVLFAHRAPVVVLNLGGIANVTLLRDADPDRVVGFDTGPGNMVIDAIARSGGRPFDQGGEGARRGRVVDEALEGALAHPFFARRAPKSAGREDFGGRFALALGEAVRERGGSPDDALATATELSARTIADAIRDETPAGVTWREVLVGGGGSANAALLARLRDALAPVPVRLTDEAGVPAQAREALAFAILAAYRLRGLPNTLPRCTGASRAVSAGALHLP